MEYVKEVFAQYDRRRVGTGVLGDNHVLPVGPGPDDQRNGHGSYPPGSKME